MASKKSQTEWVLEYLKTNGAITPLDALRQYDIMRLGARIGELRARGHNIITEDFHTPSGKTVALYCFPEKQLSIQFKEA